jgi:hypothetical protein
MMRRVITASAVVPIAAAASLLSLGSPASAAASHPVRGTYQVLIEGNSAENRVLLANHTLGPPGSYDDGSWTVQEHTVSIAYTGGQAPFQACEEAGQGLICYFSITYEGPKTPTGIASETTPGTASAYVGADLVESEPFWAVRTGGVHSGQG